MTRPTHRPTIRAILNLWFGISQPVGRRAYFLSGLFLSALKYAVDAAIVYVSHGRFWSPLEYLSPFGWSLRGELDYSWAVWTMLAWMVPFVWVGISMTVRRSADAGLPLWTALLFFVPGLNYAVMLLLSVLPTHAPEPDERRALESDRPPPSRRLTAVVIGGLAIVPVITVAIFSEKYGFSLFVGAPFVQGLVTAYVYCRQTRATRMQALGTAALSLAVAGGLLLVLGIEGILCLLMALPLALVIATIGALVGHSAASSDNPFIRPSLLPLIMLYPLLAAIAPVERPLREVETSIEIDAPPEVVWNNVTSFTELPAVSEIFFKLGIAYPIRAHYLGEGTDAVRYCEFSTGAFVEPITRWEEPHRLSFDVTEQPPTMEEWSPYQGLQPPHVEGSLRSRRGEFRLVALAGGRTRLEGSTWYELEMEPQLYWTAWSDGLIHAIHRRVLRHIKQLSESDLEKT